MTVLPALKDSVLDAATRRAQSVLSGEVAPRLARGRWRSPRRLAVGGIGALATAAAAILLSLGGGGTSTSTAFANWSATPTNPASGQLHAAELFCRQQNPNVRSEAPAVADVRGPYSMLVYAGSSTITDCTAGAQGTLMSGQSPAQKAVIAPNSIKVESWGFTHTGQGGEIASVLDGQCGPGVRTVALTLDNGTNIQTTVTNGWFAAWWPGKESARTAAITTDGGTTTQQLPAQSNIPALPEPMPVERGRASTQSPSAATTTTNG